MAVTRYSQIASASSTAGTIPAAGRFAAVSGGTTSTYSSGGVTYQVQTFTASGTLTVANSGIADVLVVAGGAGCARTNNSAQCGGGGGGVFYYPSVFLSGGTLSVTVGAGGSGTFSGTNATSTAGGTSSLAGVLEVGGGGQAQSVDFTPREFAGSAFAGGNGGGTGGLAVLGSTGAFVSGKGAAGGASAAGKSVSITGSAVTYGAALSSGAGGSNTGQGGGATNANGGSGVVIVRTVTAGAAPSGVVASGGTQTTYTGNGTNGVNGRNYVVQRFNANGTLTVTQPGYADVLIVSGGSGGGGEYASSGAGGGITFGNVYLGSGSYSVVVGAGSTLSGATATGNPGGIGGTSYLGQYGSPLSTSYSTSGPNAPLTSTITGSSVTYAQTGTAVTANTGNGGIKAGCCGAPPGALGSSGVVIVRYEA